MSSQDESNQEPVAAPEGWPDGEAPLRTEPVAVADDGMLIVDVGGFEGPLDLLLVCLGGGGLISGCAVAAQHQSPDCRVIGVEPEAGNDAQQSKRLGQIVKIDTPKTIADGAQTQQLGQLTFPVIQALVDNIVTVSDAQLVQAMRFAAARMKMVVEPTGALAMAAAMQGALDLRGKRVLFREDLNVPVEAGVISSDARIRAALQLNRRAKGAPLAEAEQRSDAAAEGPGGAGHHGDLEPQGQLPAGGMGASGGPQRAHSSGAIVAGGRSAICAGQIQHPFELQRL